MSLSAPIQEWYRVDLTFKLLSDGSTTKTIKLISRNAKDETESYFPLLRDISGCGLTVGQDGMPVSSSGSITIDDAWGSFGLERRISDLLERYTLTEQSVTVYMATTKLGDTAPHSDFESIWKGVVKSISISPGKERTLSLSVESSSIEERYITRTITEDMAATGETIPEQSLGKALPLIFGEDVTVPCYSISDNNLSAKYAYGIQMADTFPAGGATAFYAKDEDGVYRQVQDFGSNYAGLTAEANGACYPSSYGRTEIVTRVLIRSDARLIITGLRWWMKGQNSYPPTHLTPAGVIKFALYTPVQEYQPSLENPLRTAEANKADYWTSLEGSSNFWVYAHFEKPLVPAECTMYNAFGLNFIALYASMCLSAYAGATTDFTSGGQNSGTMGYYTRDGTDHNLLYVSGYTPFVQLIVTRIEDLVSSTTDASGYRHRYVAVTQPDDTGTEPDITSLDLVVTCDGLKDDSSGTITSSASSLITRPDHVANLVQRTYNGTSWVDSGKFDFSTFSSLYSLFTSGSYQRSVFGATTSETTLQEFLAQLAKEHCCYFVQRSDGKLALWPWGATGDIQAVLTDEDMRVTSIEFVDSSSVINDVIVAYGDDYLNTNSQWAASGQYENKLGALTFNKDTSSYYSLLSAISNSLYGKRCLADESFSLIGDSTSATSFAECMLRRNDHPHVLIYAEAPAYKYQDLDLMDIVSLLTTQLPAHLGSSAEAPMLESQGELVDLWEGDYRKRAKRYRAQIIGKNINVPEGGAGTWKFTFRLMNPPHTNDPT